MSSKYDAIVIGAGQAGPALADGLGEKGCGLQSSNVISSAGLVSMSGVSPPRRLSAALGSLIWPAGPTNSVYVLRHPLRWRWRRSRPVRTK